MKEGDAMCHARSQHGHQCSDVVSEMRSAMDAFPEDLVIEINDQPKERFYGKSYDVTIK